MTETTRLLDSFPLQPKAPEDAPNVLLVLTDDVGYGACSTFGGPVPTPVLDRLASMGVRYTAFHTAAMCSPTRAALLTGRNHHAVGAGAIVESARGLPGYNSVMPDSASTIGHVLSDHGYHTAFLGKHHNTPTWETSPLGPFDRWPNGLGFDYFYGFIGAATSQWEPALTENRNAVEVPDDPDYILDKDIANRAIAWLRLQHDLSPDSPFLLYLAPGTAHSPHHAPADWIATFKGAFSDGWDRVRERTFERQKAQGLVPELTRLTPRPDEIPAWDSLSSDEQRLYSRMMEVYAAMLSHWDFQFGRVIDHLERSGQLDNTIVLFVQGDNGASGEGGVTGTSNDIASMNRQPPSLHTMLDQIDDLGGPKSNANYPAGWAWSMNAPFRWFKQVASHLGGTRNGLVACWPRGLPERGAIMHSFQHVVDIAPTLYEWIGIEPPNERRGVKQQPLAGRPLHRPGSPPAVEREQYFELLGHRAFYRDGWMASTSPLAMPWQPPPVDITATTARWELYDLRNDYSQFEDVSAHHPEKLAELMSAFERVALAYEVFPLGFDYRKAMTEPRPTLMGHRSRFVYHPSATRLTNAAFPDIKNRSWQATAKVNVARLTANGALVSQGGWSGGWGLYVLNGRPIFIYKVSNNADGVFRLSASDVLGEGPHLVTVQVEHSGVRGGAMQVRIVVDGVERASGESKHSIATVIAGTEGTYIGRDVGTPMTDDYESPCVFDGELEHVVIDLT